MSNTTLLPMNSPRGKVAQSKKHLLTPRLLTKKLIKGRTYYWRVTVVGDRDDTASSWHHTRVT